MPKGFFPRCMNNDDIHCDVNENLWPNDQDRLDPNECNVCVCTKCYVFYFYLVNLFYLNVYISLLKVNLCYNYI